VVWRPKYIIDIRNYRNEGRTIYFLDETWVNAGKNCSKVWLDKTILSHRDTFFKEFLYCTHRLSGGFCRG